MDQENTSRRAGLWWNGWAWYARLPFKWAVFGLAVLAVCFPYPDRLVRHVQHWMDPNSLIEPDAPALRPYIEELTPRLEGLSPREQMDHVAAFVYEKLPYDWDWNTWGTSDYLPTVSEAISMGREDCDGQAVVAASLLSRFGFEARLVADLAHVWVATEHGETMSPGATRAIVVSDEGVRVRPTVLTVLPKSLAFGVAVFPLVRELIVVGVLWVLLLGRGGWRRAGLSLMLLVGGLMFLRAVCGDFHRMPGWGPWAGFALIGAGVGAAWLGRRPVAGERA